MSTKTSRRSFRRDRFHRDRADAVLVTTVLSMIFLCLMMGLSIDVSKNAKLKADQDSQSQQSTQIAVKSVDSRGNLGLPAVQAAVNEYKKQRGTSTYSNALMGSGTYRDEAAAFRIGDRCATRTIDTSIGKVTDAQMPYMVIRLDADRGLGTTAGSVTYVSEGGAAPTLMSGRLDPTSQYRVINAEVHDSVNNMMLDIFGMDCQDLRSTVSAIAFGSNEDLASTIKPSATPSVTPAP